MADRALDPADSHHRPSSSPPSSSPPAPADTPLPPSRPPSAAPVVDPPAPLGVPVVGLPPPDALFSEQEDDSEFSIGGAAARDGAEPAPPPSLPEDAPPPPPSSEPAAAPAPTGPAEPASDPLFTPDDAHDDDDDFPLAPTADEPSPDTAAGTGAPVSSASVVERELVLERTPTDAEPDGLFGADEDDGEFPLDDGARRSVPASPPPPPPVDEPVDEAAAAPSSSPSSPTSVAPDGSLGVAPPATVPDDLFGPGGPGDDDDFPLFDGDGGAPASESAAPASPSPSPTALAADEADPPTLSSPAAPEPAPVPVAVPALRTPSPPPVATPAPAPPSLSRTRTANPWAALPKPAPPPPPPPPPQQQLEQPAPPPPAAAAVVPPPRPTTAPSTTARATANPYARPPAPPATPSHYTPPVAAATAPTPSRPVVPLVRSPPPPPTTANPYAAPPPPARPSSAAAYAPTAAPSAPPPAPPPPPPLPPQAPTTPYALPAASLPPAAAAAHPALPALARSPPPSAPLPSFDRPLLVPPAPSHPPTPFPGPAFLDPSALKGSAARAKKAAVLAYLAARAAEADETAGWLEANGLGQAGGCSGGQPEAQLREWEGKAVLSRLLAAMVQHDGRLFGSAQVEEDVRRVLVPDLPAPSTPTPTTTTAPPPSTSPDPAPAPSAAALDHLTALLLAGDRAGAVQYASAERLWAHALVLVAGAGDKTAWAEVVKAFARDAFGGGAAAVAGGGAGEGEEHEEEGASKRQALRLTYEMFSGATGPLSIAELDVSTSGPFARSPTATKQTTARNLRNWRECAAMLAANRAAAGGAGAQGAAQEALLSLGDALVHVGWLHAGHACFLLSSHPPPLNPLGGPVPPRVHLYGASPSSTADEVHAAIVNTELVEYALSLAPVPKGHPPFEGVPYLQPYRLVHAVRLVEQGDMTTAQKYCEAITATLKLSKTRSPHHTQSFVDQLRELSARIAASGAVDGSSGSWIARTVAKPSLDGLGAWVEGRITKFVAGEGDAPPAPPPAASSSPPPPAAFGAPGAPPLVDAYSSWAPSRVPSRAASIESVSGFAPLTAAHPPAAAPSWGAPTAVSTSGNDAFGGTAGYGSYAPAAPASSDSAFGAPSYGSYAPAAAYAPPAPAAAPAVQEPYAGWGAPALAVEDEDEDLGFGNSSGSKKKAAAAAAAASAAAADAADNAASSVKGKEPAKAPAKADSKPPPAKDELKSSSSWLGKLWGGGSKKEPTPPATPGAGGNAPIKAKLGEESAFYFDKDLKRWVNKKAGADATAPAPLPPPPPSRAQTASPSHVLRPSPSDAPPLPRAPASALGMSPVAGGAPPPPPPQVRVSSAGPPPPSSGVSTTTSTPPPAPPSGGPPTRPPTASALGKPVDPLEALLSAPPSRGPTPTGSAAARKKNLRSRYVDVLEQ